MKKRILLVHPRLALAGSVIRHLPLSLLYVAARVVAAGYEVVILDNRLHPDTWDQELRAALTPDTLLVGITVWTGQPLINSREVSQLVKQLNPGIPVVWGGPHPTLAPEPVMGLGCVDYLIRGFHGSEPLYRLAEALNGRGALSGVPGLTYREAGRLRHNPPLQEYDLIPYREIPYWLIRDYSPYRSLDSPEIVFPIYTSFGCPHDCSFCISPVLYRGVRQRWVTLPPEQVADHIEYLRDTYHARQIYVYDEDSFIRLDHIRGVVAELTRRNLKINLGFRGARIDEILVMDREFLAMLAALGTTTLHLGLESGAQRVLDLYHKGITPAMILAANRKLAACPGIIPGYNLILGSPTETLAELRQTAALVLQLIQDNPRAIIFFPNKFKPYPGVELEKTAVAAGLHPPETIEAWAELDNETDTRFPWYTPEIHAFIRMFQITSYALDRKIDMFVTGNSWPYRLLKLAVRLYRPLARLRLRYNVTGCLVEYAVHRLVAARFHPPARAHRAAPAG